MKNTVGFIGLGIMGGSMAKNLVCNGFTVVGYDPSETASHALALNGGKPLASIDEVIESASCVVTSLATVAVFKSVMSRIAELKCDGKTVIEVSTMPLDVKQEAFLQLKDAGVFLLDCPVSGTGAQAATQDLVIFGSGDAAKFEQVRPVLAGFSRRQAYLGEFGNGSKMKFIANLLVGIHNAAAAEAFTLAGKAGMDLQVVFDALYDSAGASRMLQVRGPLMVKGDYSNPTARISMFMKDLDVITGFAAGLHCPTPLFGLVTQLYYCASSADLHDEDTAAVCRIFERMANLNRDEIH
jgi:L-threonate 2-dehydrogenase